MGFYARHIFPRLLERSMARPSIAEQRRLVVGQARGRVLEIGFGTGLNLPFYSNDVDRLVVIEPNDGMARWTRPRTAAATIPIEQHRLDAAAALPFPPDSFDTIISTWTMCSIRELPRALAEAHRLLRPGGRLLFIEHGLAPNPAVARWQRRLTPLFKLLGDGCHLDRPIHSILRASPLSLDHLETFYLPDTPRVGGYTYRGAATKH